MAKKSRDKPGDEPLIPLSEFEDTVRKVLLNTKEDSDKQLQESQAANVRRRKARQPRKE